MDLNSLIQYKAFDREYTSSNSGIIDHLLRDQEASTGLKKLQFDVHPEVFQEVESICELLDMSKREFLTAATWEAVQKAHQVITERQLLERFASEE